MSDVFISYARSTEPTAQTVAEALRELGYSVWLDDQLPAHRAYSDVIEERLRAAKSVVVIWSADAVKSEWVRSEAALAREGRKLVQLTVDGARLPMPFDQIQCADLVGWTGQADAPGWRQVTGSIAELTAAASAPAAGPAPAAPRTSSATGSTPEDPLRRAAAQRADAEIRLRRHALTYVLVNAGLAAINLATDPHTLWFQYPLVFWGLGLGISALRVYLKAHEGREERVARKREQMRRSDQPPP